MGLQELIESFDKMKRKSHFKNYWLLQWLMEN